MFISKLKNMVFSYTPKTVICYKSNSAGYSDKRGQCYVTLKIHYNCYASYNTSLVILKISFKLAYNRYAISYIKNHLIYKVMPRTITRVKCSMVTWWHNTDVYCQQSSGNRHCLIWHKCAEDSASY